MRQVNLRLVFAMLTFPQELYHIGSRTTLGAAWSEPLDAEWTRSHSANGTSPSGQPSSPYVALQIWISSTCVLLSYIADRRSWGDPKIWQYEFGTILYRDHFERLLA